MSKQHKAPTQVTVASTTDMTPLQEWVDRYWKPAVGLFIVFAAGILVRQYLTGKETVASQENWARLAEVVRFPPGFGGAIQAPEPSVLADLSDELRPGEAAAWAKAFEARKRIDEGDYTGARAALDQLEAEFPTHALASSLFFYDEEGPSATLPDHLRARMAAVEAWEGAHGELFENPPLPEGSPRVRINTSRGAIVVGLYQDIAPEHCANFLKLCGEGFYDSTRFHRVMKDFMIQGGDPNTRDGEPETWGQGGPDYKIPAEISPRLRHFEGVLAAAKLGTETESSGSQFYITTGTPHHLDGQHTVFGVMLEGQAVVEEIENGSLIEGSDRPQDPVVIESTEVL